MLFLLEKHNYGKTEPFVGPQLTHMPTNVLHCCEQDSQTKHYSMDKTDVFRPSSKKRTYSRLHIFETYGVPSLIMSIMLYD